VLYNLLDYLTVIAVDVAIIKKGLRSRHKDFEDAIQILCASSENDIEMIVTRNTKDYKYAEIPVLTPDEAFLKLEHLSR
jgi:precorrin isomerase